MGVGVVCVCVCLCDVCNMRWVCVCVSFSVCGVVVQMWVSRDCTKVNKHTKLECTCATPWGNTKQTISLHSQGS